MEVEFSITDVVYLVYTIEVDHPVSRHTQSYNMDNGTITPGREGFPTIIGPCVITGVSLGVDKPVYKLDCGMIAYAEDLHNHMLGAYLAYAKLVETSVKSHEHFPIHAVQAVKLGAMQTINEMEGVIDELCPVKL